LKCGLHDKPKSKCHHRDKENPDFFAAKDAKSAKKNISKIPTIGVGVILTLYSYIDKLQ